MRRLVILQVIMRRLDIMILVGMEIMNGMDDMAIMDILVGNMATKVRAKEKAKVRTKENRRRIEIMIGFNRTENE